MAIGKGKIKSIRVSQKEHDEIKRLADRAGVSWSRYVRKIALSEISQNGEKVTRHDRLKELSKEVNQLGNNLNQIAQVANTTGNINLDRINSLKKQVGLLKLEILREIK